MLAANAASAPTMLPPTRALTGSTRSAVLCAIHAVGSTAYESLVMFGARNPTKGQFGHNAHHSMARSDPGAKILCTCCACTLVFAGQLSTDYNVLTRRCVHHKCITQSRLIVFAL